MCFVGQPSTTYGPLIGLSSWALTKPTVFGCTTVRRTTVTFENCCSGGIVTLTGIMS